MTASGVADELWAEFERARALRPAPAGRATATPATGRPDGPGLRTTPVIETPFASLLRRRRSRRQFAALPFEDLSAVLVSVFRLIAYSETDDGYQRSWRPCPSAGGRHPIELVVAVDDAVGIGRGAWYFDSARLELVAAAFSADAALDAVKVALATPAPPPAAIFAVASLDRTLSRYPTGSSLVWRDAGVVLFALHLAATELGLASCITATCGAVDFDRVAGRVDVGAVALGAEPV